MTDFQWNRRGDHFDRWIQQRKNAHVTQTINKGLLQQCSYAPRFQVCVHKSIGPVFSTSRTTDSTYDNTCMHACISSVSSVIRELTCATLQHFVRMHSSSCPLQLVIVHHNSSSTYLIAVIVRCCQFKNIHGGKVHETHKSNGNLTQF